MTLIRAPFFSFLLKYPLICSEFASQLDGISFVLHEVPMCSYHYVNGIFKTEKLKVSGSLSIEPHANISGWHIMCKARLSSVINRE